MTFIDDVDLHLIVLLDLCADVVWMTLVIVYIVGSAKCNLSCNNDFGLQVLWVD